MATAGPAPRLPHTVTMWQEGRLWGGTVAHYLAEHYLAGWDAMG